MVTVDLELVDYGSLPVRNARASVFDSRIQDEIV
jgi:hypothetical protein